MTIAATPVRFNLPEYLDDTPDPDGKLREWPEWNHSELNSIGFLVLANARWPSQLRRSGEPDAFIHRKTVSASKLEERLIREDIWRRLRRPLSLSQMAILYGSNEAYLKLQYRFTDPTSLTDLAFAALLGQNVDITESLVSRLHQLSDPTQDIPSSHILFAMWVDRFDLAADLCKVKSSVVFKQEGGSERWARLCHYLMPIDISNTWELKVEEAILLEALRCAFDQKAVNLFRALVSCFVRPYRLPLDYSVPEDMRQRVDNHPTDPDFARMVRLYEDALKSTPCGPGKNDRHPFFLRVLRTEVVVLPLVAAVWLFGSMLIIHLPSPFFTAVIACGSIWTFISMLAQPKGEKSLPESVVRGAVHWVGLAFKFVGYLLDL